MLKLYDSINYTESTQEKETKYSDKLKETLKRIIDNDGQNNHSLWDRNDKLYEEIIENEKNEAIKIILSRQIQQAYERISDKEAAKLPTLILDEISLIKEELR